MIVFGFLFTWNFNECLMSCYEAQAGSKHMIPLSQHSNTGIIGMHSNVRFCIHDFNMSCLILWKTGKAVMERLRFASWCFLLQDLMKWDCCSTMKSLKGSLLTAPNCKRVSYSVSSSGAAENWSHSDPHSVSHSWTSWRCVWRGRLSWSLCDRTVDVGLV